MSDTSGPHRLADVRAVLTPAMTAALRDARAPDFYEALDRDFEGFAGHVLVSEHAFDTDWGVWEMHPEGDEIVYLLEGACDMVLSTAAGERTVALRAPGDYVVVPKGTWHTARTEPGAKALFVTPGEGTRHAEAPPD